MMKRSLACLLMILFGGGYAHAQSRRKSKAVDRPLPQTTQTLRRYDPQTDDTYKRVYGNKDLLLSFGKGLTLSTKQAFDSLIADKYESFGGIAISIWKLPPADDLYLLAVAGDRTIFLVLKKHGEGFDELSRAYDERTSCYSIGPIFFTAEDRVLIIVTSVGDAWCSEHEYEFKNGKLTRLGQSGIDVADMTTESEQWGGYPPFGRATAELRQGNYYLTMRGRGSLFAVDTYRRKKGRIAAPGVPVTYFFDGTAWRAARRRA